MRQHPWGHVLQSWEWGEVKAASGWQPYRLALLAEDELQGAAQILVRTLPYGVGRLGYVPRGPVVRYDDPALVRRMLAALRAFADDHHLISIKVEPDAIEPSVAAAVLLGAGLRRAAPVQMRSTIWVDLSASEEEMLARQKQKTRYNIRLAAKRGVHVTPTAGDGIDEWYRMYQATARRDRFSIHTREYYRTVMRVLGGAGMARLLLAHHGGDLLAGIIVFRFGRVAQYMYGASSNVKRNLMAPYLIQWEGMRWARCQGATMYDLWGIPDRLEEGDNLWGVYRHKRGYGGEIVRYIGAFDLVRMPLRHAGLERVARPLFTRMTRQGLVPGQ